MSESKRGKKEYKKYLSHADATLPKSTKYRRQTDDDNPGGKTEKASAANEYSSSDEEKVTTSHALITEASLEYRSSNENVEEDLPSRYSTKESSSHESDSSNEEILQDLTSSIEDATHDTSTSDGHAGNTNTRRYKAYLTDKGATIPKATKYRRLKSDDDPGTTAESSSLQKERGPRYRTYLCETDIPIPRSTTMSRLKAPNSGTESESQNSDEETEMSMPDSTISGIYDESEPFRTESRDDSHNTTDEEFEHLTSEEEGLTDSISEESEADGETSNSDTLNDSDELLGDEDIDMEYNGEGWNDSLYGGASATLGQTVLIIMVLVLTAGLTKEHWANFYGC